MSRGRRWGGEKVRKYRGGLGGGGGQDKEMSRGWRWGGEKVRKCRGGGGGVGKK